MPNIKLRLLSVAAHVKTLAPMRQFRSNNPWVIALLNVAVFLVVGSTAFALVAGRSELMDIILVANLVLAATVVFWWAFHSVPAFVEGRVSVLSTAKEGVLWAASLSITFSLCAVVFGSNMTFRDLGDLDFMLDLARPLVGVLAVSSAVGLASGVLLHALNRLVVRANPSFERMGAPLAQLRR